jgi:hypothetical protein
VGDSVDSTPSDSDRLTVRSVLTEALLFVVGLSSYFAVRLLVRGSGWEPLENAVSLLRVERLFFMDWELGLQQVFLDHLRPAVHVLNLVYAWGYWLILAATMVYLFFWHHAVYRLMRNAMIVSGLVGLVIFASFPVAPPRLMPMGIVDTVQAASPALETAARPGGLTNQNAAMPSFHFGWILLCGVCLAQTLRRRASKTLAFALPAVMGLTIIVTGNHYVIDAVVGGAICMLALVPWALPRRHAESEQYELQGG